MSFATFKTPVQNGLMQKVNIFCTKKWTIACILCIHKKSYKLDKGIMLIFVFEKKSAITFGEGCIYYVAGKNCEGNWSLRKGSQIVP